MTGPIQVDFESLAQGQRDIADGFDQAVAQVNKVRTECQELVDVAWKGQASTSFQGLMERYDQHANQLTQALQGIGEMIGVTSENHANTDQDQDGAVQSVMGDLDIAPTVNTLG